MEHTPDPVPDRLAPIPVQPDASAAEPETPTPPGPTFPRAFLHLLANTLVVAVIDFTVWFAITFFVFLETRSVFTTGMIAGIYLLFSASSGIWFGSLVDHHRKKTMMVISTVGSLVFYVVALVIERLAPEGAFTTPGSCCSGP